MKILIQHVILYAIPKHLGRLCKSSSTFEDDNTTDYNGNCDSPVFVQTFYLPKLLDLVFDGQLRPDYDGQFMCYDYGPCQTFDAPCVPMVQRRPTRFTGTVPTFITQIIKRHTA